MTGQQPVYERFLETGHAILDKTDAGSADASRVHTKLDAINHDWDKLHTKLGTSASCVCVTFLNM